MSGGNYTSGRIEFDGHLILMSILTYLYESPYMHTYCDMNMLGQYVSCLILSQNVNIIHDSHNNVRGGQTQVDELHVM